MNVFKAACIQVNAGTDMADNIEQAASLARQARANGAELVVMPENVSMMEWGRKNIVAKAMPEDSHAALKAFQALAIETGLWLHCGSLAILLDDGKVSNRSYFFDPSGKIVARYDKIHMFDVDLGNGESYRESATFAAGQQVVLAESPWGGIGLSICYDVRFPQLYRRLAQAGARFLVVPAAFTRTTGKAHWHVLLRARAIETGCFVLAPAQCGEHAGGRQTFGHTLIVSPWGEVLADAGEQPGYVIAPIDADQVADARGKIPSLGQDHDFEAVQVCGVRYLTE
jgi:predicted amidohydrolase